MSSYVQGRNVLFVHIPKTGGTSFRTLLDSIGQDGWARDNRFIHHDPFYKLLLTNYIDPSVYTCTIVRNPYTRAYSYFKHFCRINRFVCSFEWFLDYVRNKESYFTSTPLVKHTQSFYTYDETRSLTKIYKFEHLIELEEDFNLQLSRLNKGDYNIEDYVNDYKDSNKKIVQHIYAEDFINFNYSFNFADSL
jgi:hypothetical protein